MTNIVTYQWNRVPRSGLGFVLAALVVLCGVEPATARLSRQDARLQNGRAALEDGLNNLAIRHFEAYLKASRSKDNKARGARYLAEALCRKGDYEACLAVLAEEELILADTEWEGAEAFWGASALHELDRHAEALARVEFFEDRFPEDAYEVPVQRLRIRCHLALGETKEALAGFARFDKDHEGTREGRENLLEWAAFLRDEGEDEEAAPLLQRLVEESPGNGEARTARLWLGEIRLAEGQPEESRSLYEGVVSDTNAAVEARAMALDGLARIYESETNYHGALGVVTNAALLARTADRKNGLGIHEGILRIRLGDVDSGLTVHRVAIAAMTNRAHAAETQLALGALLLDLDLDEEAHEAYQQHLEAFGEETGRATALMGKGWSLWNRERYAEAATVFEKAYAAFETDPAGRMALIKAADAYFADEKFASALPLYEEAASMENDPAGARAAFQAAECHAHLEEIDVAREALLTLAGATDDRHLAAQAVMRAAVLSEEQGQWEEATEGYGRVLADYPDEPEVARARQRRGLVQYRLGNFQEALDDFTAVVTDFPESVVSEQAFFMRGWCHYLMGRHEEALTICTEFVERYPDSIWAGDVQFWLGEYYFNEGLYEEAEARFVMLVEQHPDAQVADDALYWAGRSAAFVQAYVRAVERYAALSKTYPGSALLPESRFAQGDALSELGEFARAVLAFEEIIKTYPDSYLVDRAMGRIGDCHFTLGADDPERYAQAVQAYREVLEAPRASVNLQVQAEYKLGRCREKMDELDAALEHYMNVVYRYFSERENGVRVSLLWFTRSTFSAAAIYEARAEWEQAIHVYERVIDAGVPAAPDAQQRIQKIIIENWLPFLRDEATDPE